MKAVGEASASDTNMSVAHWFLWCLYRQRKQKLVEQLVQMFLPEEQITGPFCKAANAAGRYTHSQCIQQNEHTHTRRGFASPNTRFLSQYDWMNLRTGYRSHQTQTPTSSSLLFSIDVTEESPDSPVQRGNSASWCHRTQDWIPWTEQEWTDSNRKTNFRNVFTH